MPFLWFSRITKFAKGRARHVPFQLISRSNLMRSKFGRCTRTFVLSGDDHPAMRALSPSRLIKIPMQVAARTPYPLHSLHRPPCTCIYTYTLIHRDPSRFPFFLTSINLRVKRNEALAGR